jgi:hypothetical protein
MRVYRNGDEVVIESIITDKASRFNAELNGNLISILNTGTGLYEVYEMLWSDIKDINNSSLLDAAATKAYLDSLFNTRTVEIDDEGRQTVRRATAKKGWHYSAICTEVKTSTKESYNKDYAGNDLNYVDIKLYDSSDVEITDPLNYGNCEKTVVTITPDYDFEVIEGDIFHHTRPTQDVRMWTLAGITALGAAGTKVFVNGVNLKYMSPNDRIESDGRSSKFMARYTDIQVGVDGNGDPIMQTFNSNQFQFILKHPAGYEHELMILLETYRA